MGQLYWRCSQLYEFVDSSSLFTPAKRQAILAAIKHRRGIMHTDMLRAGYVLDPAFLSHDTLADETVANSFYNVVEKLIPEAETRGTFTNELEKYRQQQGIFARSIAQDAIKLLQLMCGGTPMAPQRLSCRSLPSKSSAEVSQQVLAKGTGVLMTSSIPRDVTISRQGGLMTWCTSLATCG